MKMAVDAGYNIASDFSPRAWGSLSDQPVIKGKNEVLFIPRPLKQLVYACLVPSCSRVNKVHS